MKQNVLKTDNRDLMTKLFDRGINVQGIAQYLHPELSQSQIHQMICASGPYTENDRNYLAFQIYGAWKAEVSKPDYRLGESKNVKHINESQLKSIVTESIKKVLKEGNDYVIEDDVLVSDPILGDNEEHTYNCKCYNGYAICTRDEDSKVPPKIRMTYPKLEEVLNDHKMSSEILRYRGLDDLTPEDITYGDIMMAYGKVEGVQTPELISMGNKIGKMTLPPKGWKSKRINESQLKAIVTESVKKVLQENLKPSKEESMERKNRLNLLSKS